MKRHTQIIATLGPASQDPKTLAALVRAGMNIARLNCSHGNKAQFIHMVDTLRGIEKETGKTIFTLLDLQGPKIRLGKLPAKGIEVKRGQILTFYTGKTPNRSSVPLPYSPLPRLVKPGQSLLIEDGLIRTKVVSKKGKTVKVEVEVGGLLQSHKGVNLPDSILPAKNALSPKDKKDLAMGLKSLKVDAVALSFVESAEDIKRLRRLIKKLTKRSVFIIAKIERPKALIHLEEITASADGLMVARGDLGIETPAEEVPLEQRRIIAAAHKANKPVIVATQVLESMVENPLPTRAEISDAATAVFEQVSGLMLSEESAVGKYPVKAVKTLTKVIQAIETAMQSQDPLMRPLF